MPGNGEAVHLLGGDDGDGVPDLAVHSDHHLPQFLPPLHRGLQVLGELDLGGDQALLPLPDQEGTLPLN